MKHKLVFDTECSPDYWMVGFKRIDTGAVRQFELFEGHPLDTQVLLAIMRDYTLVSFNGIDYDVPMMCYCIKLLYEGTPIDETLRQLKALSDHIIASGLRSWQTEKEYGFKIPDYIDHIDLKEPVPGVAISLKLYGGRLHSKRLQDLPYDHNEPVFGWAEDRRANILAYNVNDLDTTIDLWKKAVPMIDLRVSMGAIYGTDLRSKSDAQVAEAIIKSEVSKILGRPIYRPEIRPGTRFKYTPPAFLKFKTAQLQQVLSNVVSADFVVDAKGSVEMPQALDSAKVVIGGSVYRMGIGGLHSSEKSVAHYATNGFSIIDRDVASFYPSIILRCRLSPAHVGDAFFEVYREIYATRLAAKARASEIKKKMAKIKSRIKELENGKSNIPPSGQAD